MCNGQNQKFGIFPGNNTINVGCDPGACLNLYGSSGAGDNTWVQTFAKCDADARNQWIIDPAAGTIKSAMSGECMTNVSLPDAVSSDADTWYDHCRENMGGGLC